jgi:hypothetical protein
LAITANLIITPTLDLNKLNVLQHNDGYLLAASDFLVLVARDDQRDALRTL